MFFGITFETALIKSITPNLMKKFLTLLLASMSFQVFAQNGNMIFFTEDHENFTLTINGVTIPSPLGNTVNVLNKPVAKYKIQVTFQKPQLGKLADEVFTVAGSDKTFVIKPRKEADIQAEIAKNSKNPNTAKNEVSKYLIKVLSVTPAAIAAETINDVNYNNAQNRNEHAAREEHQAQENEQIANDVPTNVNINIDPNGISIQGAGVNLGANVNINGVGVSGIPNSTRNGTVTKTTTTTTTTQNSGTANYNNGVWCVNPLTNAAFQMEEKKVRIQTTEAGKIIAAQQLSMANCLTSAQIKTLCTSIFNERDRLAYAEYAYPRCYDPSNYTLVYSAFYSNANVDELNRFIHSYSNTTNGTYNNNSRGNVDNPRGYNGTNNNQNSGGYVSGYSGPYGCSMPMGSNDFNAAKESIRSKSFESTKLEIAKQVTGSNCFTASQIKEIMSFFSFESSKLEYAKSAYTHCYDKNNYFKVNDSFGFESSITELNNYIKGK